MTLKGLDGGMDDWMVDGLMDWRMKRVGGGVDDGKDAGQCEHQHPPWWCWSQLVCPGEGWAVCEGDSSPSTRGGLVLSCPTGGGHGRSLITLISTASVAPSHQRRDGGKERTATRGINGQPQRKWGKGSYGRKQGGKREKEEVKNR